jgi:hypothetical protein
LRYTKAAGSWRSKPVQSRSGAALACELPGFHESLSVVDTTPLPCGQSLLIVNR